MRRATTILLLVLAAGVLRAAGQNASAPGGASATGRQSRRMGSGRGRGVPRRPDGHVVCQRHQAPDRRGEDVLRVVPLVGWVCACAAGPPARLARGRTDGSGSQAHRRNHPPRRVVQHARAPLRDQRRQEGRVAWDRGRAEPRRPGERRCGRRPARARQRHAEGAHAPVGNAAGRWRVGLAQLQARAVRNRRRRLPRRDARGARRRHGPRRRDVRRRREAARLPPRSLRRAEPLQP